MSDSNFKEQQEDFPSENVYTCGAVFHQLQVNTQVSISGNEKVRRENFFAMRNETVCGKRK